MSARKVPDLARQAEGILVEIAKDGPAPVTYGWLADRLTEDGEAPLPAVLMGTVLGAMRDTHRTWFWTPYLTAFVVNEDTGEPGEGFYVAGLGDAAEVRASTHRRLVSGVYDPDFRP